MSRESNYKPNSEFVGGHSYWIETGLPDYPYSCKHCACGNIRMSNYCPDCGYIMSSKEKKDEIIDPHEAYLDTIPPIRDRIRERKMIYVRTPASPDHEMYARIPATPEYERELERERGMDRSR